MSKKLKSGFAALASVKLTPQEQLAPIKSNSRGLVIGLPKERSLQENRICMIPDSVALLVNNGHEILVETGAGEGANFSDHDYSEAGAKIVSSAREVFNANTILKIEPPTLDEIGYLKNKQTLISAIQPGHLDKSYITALLQKKVSAFAWEFIEDKLGGMPIISCLSEIAGSCVMFIASEYLSSMQNGKGIMLGGVTGVQPTKVVIIGAGTAAEYTARVAMSLGAEIQVFDNHLYKLRRLKSTLGQQLYTCTIDNITLSESLKSADVVIGALRAEKGRVRHVISEEMVSQMKPNSLIIDLSIDQGGCIATSRVTTHARPTFRKHDVIHYCVPNVTSRVARTTSTALSNIFTPTILRTGKEGGLENMIFSYKYKWFLKGLYTYNGNSVNEYLSRKFGLEYRDLELILAARA